MAIGTYVHRAIDSIGLAPGVRELRRRRYERAFARNTSDLRMFRGVYPTFDDALASAPRGAPTGYDHPVSATLFDTATDRLRGPDYPAMFWLRHFFDQGARVLLDYGGHVGGKFHTYRRFISLPPHLKWVVLDVPAVVREGKKRAHDPGSLHFIEDLSQSRDVDIFFASGSLQYVESEPWQLLSGKPRFVLINETPVHPLTTYYTLNSLGHTFCPYRIWSGAALLQDMQRLGYRPLDQWKHPEKTCIIPFERAHSLDHYCGFAFERI